MSIAYVPASADALADAFSSVTFNDPGASAYSAANSNRIDAKYFLKPVQDEILANIKALVARQQYQQTFACATTVSVGDPLYISAANTVALALASSKTTCRVIGTCAYKPSTTTCVISHYYYKSGLAGLTPNAPVYLSNSGSIASSKGDVAFIIGTAISSTEAVISVDPLMAQLINIFLAEGTNTEFVYQTVYSGLALAQAPFNFVNFS